VDIKVTSTGKTFYRIDPALGAILLEALPSVFERVEPAPKPVHVANAASAAIRNVATPEWNVGKSPSGMPVITLRSGRAEFSYPGSVQGATAHFKLAGFELPKDVLERYQRLVESQKNPEWLAEQARNRRDDLELAQRRANGE